MPKVGRARRLSISLSHTGGVALTAHTPQAFRPFLLDWISLDEIATKKSLVPSTPPRRAAAAQKD